MGNEGGSWTGLFSFWALAILMAALGPAPAPQSPVVDVVETDTMSPSRDAPATYFVASR